MEHSNSMRKLLILIVVIILCFWGVITFDIVPPIFWSFKAFSNPNYSNDLEKEWTQKTSPFLLLKLHSIDPMRFGLAAYLLAQRREERAINILIKKVQSHYIDGQMHFSACSALAQISPEIAKNILEELIEKYRKSTWHHNSAAYQRYRNALHILATMKDESVYPICLQMAKFGDRLEKESSLNGMLYYFDNHAEEILPLYLDYLNTRKSPKGQTIKAIKNLKQPEAIPTLEEFASKNKDYEKDAQDAILYLKELQK